MKASHFRWRYMPVIHHDLLPCFAFAALTSCLFLDSLQLALCLLSPIVTSLECCYILVIHNDLPSCFAFAASTSCLFLDSLQLAPCLLSSVLTSLECCYIPVIHNDLV